MTRDNPLEVVEVPLSAARDYILGILDDSRRSLGEALGSSVDLSVGRVITWAPENASLPRDFSQGGLLPEASPESWKHGPGSIAKPVESTAEALATEIQAFLSAAPGRVCLLANENVDPGDPVAATLPAKATYGKELYHLISPGLTDEEVVRILKRARSVPVFLGVLSSTSGLPSNENELGETTFRSIVAGAQGILVGAFDGEGFLVWKRA